MFSSPLLEIATAKQQATPLQLLQVQKISSQRTHRSRRIRHSKQPGLLNRRKCLVCGEKAINYNFGVITCESCKAFFRRNIDKLEDLHCSNEDWSCTINVENRRYCSACRMKKCFEIGMTWNQRPQRPRSVPEAGDHENHSLPPQLTPLNTFSNPHQVIESRPHSSEGTTTEFQETTGLFTSAEWDNIQNISNKFAEIVVKANFPGETRIVLLQGHSDVRQIEIVCDFLIETVVKFLTCIPEYCLLREDTKKILIANQITGIFTAFGVARYLTEKSAFLVSFADQHPAIYLDLNNKNSVLHAPEYDNFVKTMRHVVVGDSLDLCALLVCLKLFEDAEKHVGLLFDSIQFLNDCYQQYTMLFCKLLALKFPMDFENRWKVYKEIQKWNISDLEDVIKDLSFQPSSSN